MNEYSKKERYLIINIIIVYLFATFFLYWTGPIDYTTIHPILLVLYIFLAYLLLYYGFRIGVRKQIGIMHYQYKEKKRNYRKLINWLLFLSIILIPFGMLSRTGIIGINWESFNNIGEAYYNADMYRSSSNGSIAGWIRIVGYPFVFAMLPLGTYLWKHMTKIGRLLYILTAITYLIIDMTAGISKGLADYIIILSTMFIIIMFKNAERKKDFRLKKITLKREWRRFIRIGLCFVIVFVMYFSFVMISRHDSVSSYNHSSVFTTLTSYLTQGYQALDYSFSEPFQSTFGFGSSMYTLSSTKSWFGTEYFWERSYIYKIYYDYNWDWKVRWSSCFVWLANDFSLIGVLILLYFVGVLMGRCWIRVLKYGNIESIVIFCILCQFCFYLPANNQIMQLCETLLATIVWAVLYFFHKNDKVEI